MYELPKTVEIGGKSYAIETDYRAILDIFEILNAPELSGSEKSLAALGIFYREFFHMPEQDIPEAIEQMTLFINGGQKEREKKSPKLMDWEQDFSLLIAPLNRVAGAEIRALEYMHWWTFLAYFNEIGDCYFAHVVRIRDLKARGKLKEKTDKEFYRKNRDVIDIKTRYTDEENALIAMWT